MQQRTYSHDTNFKNINMNQVLLSVENNQKCEQKIVLVMTPHWVEQVYE